MVIIKYIGSAQHNRKKGSTHYRQVSHGSFTEQKNGHGQAMAGKSRATFNKTAIARAKREKRQEKMQRKLERRQEARDRKLGEAAVEENDDAEDEETD